MDMEWNERLALVRKAAGLTQEQLGDLVGVTRQAVSKWESAQTVPDMLTITRVCQALHVSTDYVLLGKEPGEETAPKDAAPDLPAPCPCCGRETSGGVCPACGYLLPSAPAGGPLYAVVGSFSAPLTQPDLITQLTRYCGLTEEEVAACAAAYSPDYPHNQLLLCRGKTAHAAWWIASHLDRAYTLPRIVEDCGEAPDILRVKGPAMDTPKGEDSGGIGFWGVVGAVIVAVLILSFL